MICKEAPMFRHHNMLETHHWPGCPIFCLEWSHDGHHMRRYIDSELHSTPENSIKMSENSIKMSENSKRQRRMSTSGLHNAMRCHKFCYSIWPEHNVDKLCSENWVLLWLVRLGLAAVSSISELLMPIFQHIWAFQNGDPIKLVFYSYLSN
jgi:hypothetical protein